MRLGMPYDHVEEMPYGKALVAHVRHMKIEADKLEALKQ